MPRVGLLGRVVVGAMASLAGYASTVVALRRYKRQDGAAAGLSRA